tara:strand:+ start:664 stop:978 length:315 start_codon:yes stop_codon:yes gene_type:complete
MISEMVNNSQYPIIPITAKHVKPQSQAIITEPAPVDSSTNGYRHGMGSLQLKHLPPNTNQLNRGMFCQGFILFLHLGQCDAGFDKLNGVPAVFFFTGSRIMGNR